MQASFLEFGGFSDFRNKANSRCSWYMILSKVISLFCMTKAYAYLFSICLASSNKMSLSSYAIKLLWPCASVNIGTCPSSIFFLLSSSPLFFFFFLNKNPWVWWLTLLAFLFVSGGWWAFVLVMTDSDWCRVRVWPTQKMYITHLWGNRFERAQNVQDSYVESWDYSHICMWHW